FIAFRPALAVVPSVAGPERARRPAAVVRAPQVAAVAHVPRALVRARRAVVHVPRALAVAVAHALQAAALAGAAPASQRAASPDEQPAALAERPWAFALGLDAGSLPAPSLAADRPDRFSAGPAAADLAAAEQRLLARRAADGCRVGRARPFRAVSAAARSPSAQSPSWCA